MALSIHEVVRVACQSRGWFVRNSAQEIQNPTNDWNLESKFH